jgi:foldase protein PrsA
MSPNKPKRLSAKLGLLSLALVLTTSVFAGCAKNEAEGGQAAAGSADVVATYKDGQVSKAEFDSFKSIIKFVNPMYGMMADDPSSQQPILEQLVAFKILEQRADDAVKKEAETKTKQQLDEIGEYFKQQSGNAGEFDKAMQESNVKREDFEAYVKRSIVVSDSFNKKITEDQLKSEYDNKLKADPHMFTTATVAHILVGLENPADGSPLRTKEEALKRANEVKDKLTQGGDFAALAKEYSDDPGSKDAGGKYENVEVGNWVEGFKKAAVELPLNQISDPVETEFGYHVMKVENRSSLSFDNVKENIRSELAEKEITKFMDEELKGLITSTNLPPVEPAATGGAATNGAAGATGTATPAPAATEQK